MRVARTGQGWEEFRKREREIVESNGSWLFQSRGPFTSVEQLRWDWDHILTFSPLRHDIECDARSTCTNVMVCMSASD